MCRAARFVVLALVAGACTRPSSSVEAEMLPLDRIRLPRGFEISVYASGVRGARQMALGDGGTVFVGSLGSGDVYAVADRDRDGRSDSTIVVDSGLKAPSGVAFRDGALWVADVDRVLRYDDIEKRAGEKQRPVTVTDDYPADRHHGWKFIGFGPDGWLYVPVGAPCNVCAVSDPYATITRMRPDGSAREVVARGVRNTVGFDWHPETKELWFTENGRDQMGDNRPPDELNRMPKAGLHFGFPFCHGADVADPEYGAKRPCGETTAPERSLDAHVAAIGMRFYTGKAFPAEYRNAIFVAEHGSWNRSVPIGYRVMVATLDGSTVKDYRPFAEGWLENGRRWGRPADVLPMPDGSLLVSDDTADAIYRIRYTGDR